MLLRMTSEQKEGVAPRPARPWRPADATRRIRDKVTPALQLMLTRHAKDRLQERDLLISDVLHVLRQGTVYETAEPATRPGLFKYQMERTTPNSNGRSVRLVVIPSPTNATIKVVTIMWVDKN